MSIFPFFEDWKPLFGGLYVMNDGVRNFSATVMEAMSTTPCRGDDVIELVGCRDDGLALRLKMIAIVTILIAGVIGVSIPLVGKKRKFLRTDSALFVFFKAFAAGVILATGFVHMLPDGQKALTDPCLPKSPWSDFPFSGFVAMLASLGTLVLDFLATQFYERKHLREEEAVGKISSPAVADEDGITVVVEATDEQEGSCSDDSGRMHIVGMHVHAAAHGHSHGDGDGHGHGHGHGDGGHVHRHTHALEEDSGGGPSSHVRHVVVSQILEMGIVSHSVIIGLSLGLSRSTCTIRPLIGALSFHQFFEGFALGGCISQAHLSNLASTTMACFFAVTTPTGIAVGAALSSFYDSNSPLALVIEGVFDCISAGILIYMALVDLIAADFLSQNMRCNLRLQFSCYIALFVGAVSMSILALWA